MTVKGLIEALQKCNPDAIVYVGSPNQYGSDYQAAHENVGVSYLVSNNEEVWFETYGSEDIAGEVDSIEWKATMGNWTDWDFVAELLGKDNYGYTLEDIKRNCSQDIYDFVVKTMKEYGYESEKEI